MIARPVNVFIENRITQCNSNVLQIYCVTVNETEALEWVRYYQEGVNSGCVT